MMDSINYQEQLPIGVVVNRFFDLDLNKAYVIKAVADPFI